MKHLFLRAMSRLNTALYRLTAGKVANRMGKAPILLLTVAGRKSGKRRTTPLLYGRDGDNYVVIASMGGAPKHPAWYHNLQGQEAEIQVGRKRLRVRARDAEGEERERLWAMALDNYSGYQRYQTRAGDRTIPVVALRPR